MGCDEIDPRDAHVGNQVLTSFGFDVNKSYIKERCTPGKRFFHFWTDDFALHVHVLLCSSV